MNDKRFDEASRLLLAGDLAEAARLYSEVLRSNPRHFEALYRLGAIHFQNARFAEAEYLFAAASRIDPQVAEPFYSRGCALQNLKRDEDALICFARALAIRPGYIEARNNRGSSLLRLRQFEEALACFDKVLSDRPNEALVHSNRASALSELKRYDEALAAAERALRLNTDDPGAWYNQGAAQLSLARFGESIVSFDKAIALASDYGAAFAQRGVALFMLGRHDDALKSYDRALQLTPDEPSLLNHRCNALLALRRFKDAIAESEELLFLDPDFKFVRGNMLYAKLQIGDWSTLAQDKADLRVRLQDGLAVMQPLQNALISTSEADQLRCSRIWTKTVSPPAASPAWRGERYRHDRIRLAYVSQNLRAHAVAHAIAGVFEHHDRNQFETIAIALNVSDGSATYARLTRAFDQFVTVADKSDTQVAALLREMEVDVAVDLMGFTENARSGIFAARPAPVQVNYLGFPGTMGAPYMDYILVDPIAVPPTEQPHYAEKLVHLPDSYMPCDGARTIAPIPSRARAGLPKEGFVFCSFNTVTKINPEMFDVWMRLIRAVEGSVLWLSSPAGGETAKANLKREAELRGVTAERILFAPFVAEAADHLARLSLTDLFLDTVPYNAHAGGVDALWAGVPIVTCAGSTFASRVGASLLIAAGLPELTAASLQDYEALALALARDPAQLALMRAKLSRNRGSRPLFDTQRFTRNLEAAFIAMWKRQQRGEAPASFTVGLQEIAAAS